MVKNCKLTLNLNLADCRKQFNWIWGWTLRDQRKKATLAELVTDSGKGLPTGRTTSAD